MPRTSLFDGSKRHRYVIGTTIQFLKRPALLPAVGTALQIAWSGWRPCQPFGPHL